MSRYTVLIYEDEAQYASATPEVLGEIHAAHDEFAGRVEELGGKILGGDALQPSSTATSLRRAGSEVTDGPFAETKEVLGGFYLIDAPDLDVALAIGKACPARFGGVEVRPVMSFD